MGSQPAHDTRARPPERRNVDRARLAAAAILGGVVVAFALLNLEDVEVDWIVGSWETPLIVVIGVSFVLGVAADRLLKYRSRRRAGRS